MRPTSEQFLRPPVWGALRPDRFAATFATADPAGCTVALLGLADDLGVRLNRMPVGPARGPDAFRRALAGYATPFDAQRHERIGARVFDAGDVVPADGSDAEALAQTHQRVREVCTALHELGLVVVCVGGGHDLSSPAIGALRDVVGQPVGGINVDPHLDVRPSPCSGMPFRPLLDAGHVEPTRFAELGTGRFDNDEAHLEYLRDKGARVFTIDDWLAGKADTGLILDDCIGPGEAGFVSIDLDVIDASQAPGVSAPNPMGVGVADVASVVRHAARNPGVRHLDLMELCPPRDVDDRTARVAAHLFVTFVASLESRNDP